MKKQQIETAVFLTPSDLAERWRRHPETIRRKIRKREISSILIDRRRLVAMEEIHRIEQGGLTTRADAAGLQANYN